MTSSAGFSPRFPSLENGVNEFFAVNDVFAVGRERKKLLKKKL